MTARDTLYAARQQHIAPFCFDDSVAAVFDDMLLRSIPGYTTIIDGIATLAAQYAVDHSAIYDLGCSLGTMTLAVATAVDNTTITIEAVDNAAAMIGRCQQNIASYAGATLIRTHCADIRSFAINNASVVIVNFTLQFVPPADKAAVIDTIFTGLRPGGILLLAEKICGANNDSDAVLTALYHRFKRRNGYSELEIQQKWQALRAIMTIDTIATHHNRLATAGFVGVDTWYQHYNFAAMLAQKPL